METMQLVCGYGVCLFMGLLVGTLLWFIWTNKIDLSKVLSEANGSASMSRLQLMIFTLVIAISIFMMVEKTGKFPEISDGVLTLLGISASTYAVGKGISYSRNEGVTSAADQQKEREMLKQVSDSGAKVTVTADKVTSSGAPAPQADAISEVIKAGTDT